MLLSVAWQNKTQLFKIMCFWQLIIYELRDRALTSLFNLFSYEIYHISFNNPNVKGELFNYNAICHSQIYSCPNYLNNEFKDQSRFELWYFFWKSYKPYFMAKQNIRICFYQQNIKDIKATYIFPSLSTHNYWSQVKEIYSCWRNNETFNSLRLFHIK